MQSAFSAILVAGAQALGSVTGQLHFGHDYLIAFEAEQNPVTRLQLQRFHNFRGKNELSSRAQFLFLPGQSLTPVY